MLNPLASAFACAYNKAPNPIVRVDERLQECKVSDKDRKQINKIILEWYTAPTLNSILTKWHDHNNRNAMTVNNHSTPMIFVAYNVQGLCTRSLEVTELINKVDASFIVCTEVGEIWNKHPLPDYKMFYEKGTNKNGGVVVAVGKHLKAIKIETRMDNTVVVDIFGLNEPLRVIGIYWPEKQKRDINEISKLITENTIIAGDFNASVRQWNSPATDKRGEIVEKWCRDNHLEYIEGTKNSSKRSLRNIDFTFANLPGITGETLDVGSSDHRPLLYKSEFIRIETINSFEIVKWNHYEIVLGLLQEFWIEQARIMQSTEWYKYYSRFLAALKNRLTSWVEKDKWKPALPSAILEQLRVVRRIKNRLYKNHREEDRVILRHLEREVRKEISSYRESRWNSFLSNIQNNYGNDMTSFWKHLTRIYRPSALPFNKLAGKTKQLTSPSEIVKELSEYYSNLFTPAYLNPTDRHTSEIEQEYTDIINDIPNWKVSIKPTNITEIKEIIRKLKAKKSAGVDNISNFMIKKLPPGYLDCLCTCFNDWLSRNTFPEEWKLAKIVTLNKLKAGIPSCDQTRPISLLATHSKIYEKILLNRVQEWATANRIIPDEQSGFRKGCQLQTRVLSIYQEVKNNLAGNIPVMGIYVDYKKAYDLVWHKGLIVKLCRMQIPPEILKMLIYWLEGRKAYISFGSTKSETFNMQIGLPQGSALSPFVFIVYHADIVTTTNAFSTHIFADDLCTLIVPPIDRKYANMMKSLEIEGTKICKNIHDYACKWQQPINVSKTVFQVFHSQVRVEEITVSMDGIELENVKKFKYLGWTWTDKLSLKPTVDLCLNQIEKSYVKIKWLKRNKNISTKVLRTCFFAYSFPFFTWIFPFFAILPKSQQELIQRKYRVGLRLIHRCSFVETVDLFKFTKEKTLEQYVSRYLKKRLANAHRTDLGRSLFYEEPFHWSTFNSYKEGDKDRRKHLGVGHLFRLARVRKMCERHESYIASWLSFVDSVKE